MRYSIMLQLVLFITLVLVAGAALFAWVQSRPDFEGNGRRSSVEEQCIAVLD
jgi:hypothetical protein